jgi:hypothetical protein
MIKAKPVNMSRNRESELTTNLMQAEARLGIIARVARLNMEELLDDHEFARVLQTILAASGHEEKS